MKIHLIAVHNDINGKPVGFRLLDSDSGQVMDQPYDKVKAVIQNKVTINGLKLMYGNIVGSNGSLDRYPTFVNNNLTKKSIVIIATIDDNGYRVCNHDGKIVDQLGDVLIAYCNKNRADTHGSQDDAVGIANGKIVTRDNKQYISAISGTYDNIQTNKSDIKDKVQITIDKKIETNNNNNENDKQTDADNLTKNQQLNNSNKLNISDEIRKKRKEMRLKRQDDPRYPSIVSSGLMTDRMKEFDPSCNMTLEDKFGRAILALKEVRPFYYAIFISLKQRESSAEQGMETMGVSTDTLYYNPDFIKWLTEPELLFVLLHEICHIAMLHRAREMGRDHDAWNMATDYYINKNLALEFGLEHGKERYANTVAYKDPDTNPQYRSKYKIAIPREGCFNDKVDIENDIPEKLYDELMESLDNQDQNSEDQSGDGQSGDGQSGENQGEQGQSNQNQNGEGQGQGNQSQKGQSNQGQNGQEQEQNIEEHKDNKQDDQTKNGQEHKDNKQGQNSNEGNKSEECTYNPEEQRKKGRFAGKEFRGDKISEDYSPDMVDSPEEAGKSPEELGRETKRLIRGAVEIAKQMKAYGGDQASFIERLVEKELAPKVNWRSILRKFLTRANQKEYTFAHPDKRFLGRKNPDGSHQVFAGPHMSGQGELENIKIAIDASGSITAKDLGVALTQIEDMFKKYSAKAELLYWDTRVRAVYEFSNVNELLKKEPMGGGGTDVNCVFDYFESDRDYKIHKKAKPSLIIIFTDGYFGAVDKKYKNKYKNTIWVLHNNEHFEAPFGVKAPFKIEDF